MQKLSKKGEFLSKFGSKGSNNGQFNCPAGIAVDAEGHVVVADLKNLCVQIFDCEGGFVKKIGEQDSPVKGGNNVFSKPTGVAISGNGNVVVADRGNHRVQVF